MSGTDINNAPIYDNETNTATGTVATASTASNGTILNPQRSASPPSYNTTAEGAAGLASLPSVQYGTMAQQQSPDPPPYDAYQQQFQQQQQPVQFQSQPYQMQSGQQQQQQPVIYNPVPIMYQGQQQQQIQQQQQQPQYYSSGPTQSGVVSGAVMYSGAPIAQPVTNLHQPLIKGDGDSSLAGINPIIPVDAVGPGLSAGIEIDLTDYGVRSFDPQLSNQSKILEFLQLQTARPGLTVSIHGHHTEHYTTYSTNSKGHRTTHHHTRQVTDFHYYLPLTQYIHPVGTIINPHAEVDRYVVSKNLLKELSMNKIIKWDFTVLTELIIMRLRETGYAHSIDITYPKTNYKVKIEAPGSLSRCCHNTGTKILLWLSCLCLIWYPIKWMYSDRPSAIECHYLMNITVEQWFNQHRQDIHR